MQTSNYQIDLLSQNQAMKEYTINHAFNKVDWLLNRSAIALVQELPEAKAEGDMYLCEDGKLSIYLDEHWQSLTPSEGTVLYVRENRSFCILENKKWRAIDPP